MVLAPAHDRLPSKTAVGPYDDPHLVAKTPANGRHDLLQCFKAPFARIAFTIPQLGQERNVTAKAVKRQVAVGTIVAVKVGPFLAAMERIVGGVQIQHDLGTFTRNGFDSPLD